MPNKQYSARTMRKTRFHSSLMFRKESSANLVSNIKRIRFLMVPVGSKFNLFA